MPGQRLRKRRVASRNGRGREIGGTFLYDVVELKLPVLIASTGRLPYVCHEHLY
ncbi:MAG: hypothetical protein JWM11_6596 [Planctomycetaceae bacterium]|nr:hypothetical protein [Planctomycetaceae bacterium]